MISGVEKKHIIITILCCLAAIWGNFKVADVHIIGVVPTYYRVIIPVAFALTFILNYRDNGKSMRIKQFDFSEKLYYGMVIFWLAYGAVSICFSPYSDPAAGCRELLAVGLGALQVFVVSSCVKRRQFDPIIIALKIAVAVMVFVGIVEIISGYHLPASKLSDENFISWCAETYGWEESYEQYPYLHMATGLFYNVNDFCAFLAIFSPLFCYWTKDEKGVAVKLCNYIMLLLVITIVLIDDAFICFVAMLVGLIIILLLKHAKVREWFFTAAVVVCARIIAGINSNNIEMTLVSQFEGAFMQENSLALRLNTYTEGIEETFTSGHGLGLGAGSFENYFVPLAEARHMMPNPHCLWLEILFEYGIPVMIGFCGFLVYLLVKLFIINHKVNSSEFALVISMGITFSLACFAPSAFLGYSYYWLVIGLGIGLTAADSRGSNMKGSISDENEPE